MSRFNKFFAVTATVLSLGLFAAPMASAASTPSAQPVVGGGSVVLCFPTGSVTLCF